VGGEVRVLGPAVIDGRASLKGKVFISGGRVTDDAVVDGDAVIRPGALIDGDAEVWSGVHAGAETPTTPREDRDRATLADMAAEPVGVPDSGASRVESPPGRASRRQLIAD